MEDFDILQKRKKAVAYMRKQKGDHKETKRTKLYRIMKGLEFFGINELLDAYWEAHKETISRHNIDLLLEGLVKKGLLVSPTKGLYEWAKKDA